ncbi:hypothetical protein CAUPRSCDRAFT_10587 [Caulochytrium protostelioides]|uniref:Uncharacterized protein n=1 Tax=Caulochytrium protostelioides TaxID=1555241 RepID=A0A4P9WZE0_9FUNG|nr:hypothetical protein CAUPRSCDRAFT_10587 [Caulochytrium protostelioides]
MSATGRSVPAAPERLGGFSRCPARTATPGIAGVPCEPQHVGSIETTKDDDGVWTSRDGPELREVARADVVAVVVENKGAGDHAEGEGRRAGIQTVQHGLHDDLGQRRQDDARPQLLHRHNIEDLDKHGGQLMSQRSAIRHRGPARGGCHRGRLIDRRVPVDTMMRDPA